MSLQHCPGCLQLLEISLNLYCPPGNFCVTCRWSTALVSNYDETGHRIAYLRNWSPFFIFAAAPCCAYHVSVLYLAKLEVSVHCVACRSNANMSWIFLEIPPGISWKFVQLNLYTPCCRCSKNLLNRVWNECLYILILFIMLFISSE